ncbi:MAG TPA: response regulator [Polyangiaceae bacterium]|nr:response regulator [Polyangiaceae bacterium]
MTRILIVEDDPTQARALRRAFGKLRPDLHVSTAANGLQAMQLMAERSVDLILTDLQMPEMDGFQLLAWLHNNHPDVAVFTMSAFGTKDTAAELTSLGALEYFAKPVDAKQVLGRLTDALNQSVRGHVQNVSLASLLQLLEMERKTCTLHVTCDDNSGVLVLRKGALVSARSGELQGEAAAIAVIAWPYPSITISRHCESSGVAIQESLGFIVMEAMRLQDEAMRSLGGNGVSTSWPAQPRTWRPGSTPSDRPLGSESSRPRNGDMGLPSGARAVAMVETATGNILCSTAEHDFPVGELARMAAQLLTQEAATLRLCAEAEGVEELVLSTSSRCDVIRPLGGSQFALLVFAPEETNLVMARLELDRFIALQHLRR